MKTLLVFLVVLHLSACATYHSDLMTNDELIEASCRDLALEQQRISENIEHTSQASTGGMLGSMFLALLEGYAASPSGGGQYVGNSGSTGQAQLAAEHRKTVVTMEQRKGLVAQLRARKGC